MNWKPLESMEQLEGIKDSGGYSVIFKHSTRCSVSMFVKKRFESEMEALPQDLPVYYLDLLKYRDISDRVASEFDVHHQSPQVLLIKQGKCVYKASHSEISVADLQYQLTAGK